MPHARTAPQQPRWSTPARYAAVAAFVGVWMAAGWLLGLGTKAYLLLGIPLTLAFHKLVRRLPLRALRVVDAPPLRVGRRMLLFVVLLALLPLVGLVTEIVRRDTGRDCAGECRKLVQRRPGVASLIECFAVVFVMEEVSFRALDRHLGAEATLRGLPSALFVTMLWGLWHLPIAGVASLRVALRLIAFHLPMGLLLSYGWRRTGNLAPPALAHALADGIRNALVLTP